MAINNPGIPNGGFVNPTPVAPRASVANPGIPNGGFTTAPPPTPSVATAPPPAQPGTPPNSGIPAWVSQGNDPYKNPYLETFYNTFKQSPAFAMNLLQKLPGMNNLVLSAVNGGPLGRASINNPALADFKGLENYYSNLGPNAGRPSGLIENLGYNFNQGYNNLEGGWTVAPGGMSNIGAINKWSQLLQKAAMSNDSTTYHNLMSNVPQGVQLINFGSNNPYGTAPASTTNGTTPAGTTNGTTPTTTGNQTTPTNNGTNPYGAGYTGYGNTRISTLASGAVGNPTGAGPQGQAPGTAGSFVAGPTPAPEVSNVNTNASALPPATPNPAGTSGQGSFISTSVPKPQVRTKVFAGGNPNFNELRPPTMANIGQASLRYPHLVNRTL